MISRICLVVLSLVTVTSCLKKVDLSQDSLGPAIDPLEMTRTLGAAIGTFDYNEIKPTEMTSVMFTQRIQESTNQQIQQEKISVIDIVNDSEKLFLDVSVQKEDYSGGQTSLSSTRWPLTFKKATSSGSSLEAKDNAQPPVLLFLTFQDLAFNSCYDSGNYPETCHNLSSTDVSYKVPVAATNEHDCADPNQCYIPAKKIEFDLVSKYIIDKNGKPRRTHYTLVISPHVPFLSRILKICTRGIYEITSANQEILVDMCYTVNDYEFPAPPATP